MRLKYFNKKIRYNPKRALFILFLFLFLGGLTIGYAFLTQTLEVEGVSQVVGATWDIHFENIQVKSGSVTPTSAATITNPTSITFGVTLENPGDFYEFNVDVVNDGTFDAMISSYSFLPVLTSAQQEYLEYTVTYHNDVPLGIYQRLNAGTQETLKVRFGYKDGLDASLYPYVDQELTIQVEIVYVQADENAVYIPFYDGPALTSGLIPVKIANDGTVTAISKYDDTWYDYENKIWANAVLVTETNRSTYQVITNSFGGSMTIPSSDILAYYVWIPRYSYKIWTLDASGSHQGQEQSIDIKFVDLDTKELGTTVGSYRTHPAFTFGSEELPGFWVGKFESSTDTTSTCYTSPSASTCNNNDHLPRILPNVYSLVYQKVSNQFASSLQFSGGTQSGSTVTFSGSNYYGLSSQVDSHMMKNNEWGAVAYLSHSSYGINAEVRMNNYYLNNPYYFITGCGASSTNPSATSTCEIVYGTVSSYPQSTTGNISGIFDMSGGAYDRVMGNHNNTISNSGFSTLPSSKYYDLYSGSVFTGNDYSTNYTFCTLGLCGGHALNETRKWYNDKDCFVYSNYSWFGRGGYSNDGNGSSGLFYTGCHNGAGNYSAWRSVLIAR